MALTARFITPATSASNAAWRSRARLDCSAFSSMCTLITGSVPMGCGAVGGHMPRDDKPGSPAKAPEPGLFIRQQRPQRAEVEVEIFGGEPEMLPELGHPVLEGHEGPANRLDLVVG